MSTAFQRGLVLYSQGRRDLAEREFRRALGEEPDDPGAHAFLALCLSARDADAEALSEADEAVRLAPASGFSHMVRGHALLSLKRLPEAEDAAREAIRLDPEDADYRVLLGNVALSRRHWEDALGAADGALALDGQHIGARNLRAMALTNLGRKAEAAATLGEALAEDPEDAFSHANQGWVALHASQPDKALEHFREALRLDPTMEFARLGIVEALKAKHLVYRLMLRFFLWLGRQSQAAQWAFVLALVLGPRLLRGIAQDAPYLKPFVMPVQLLIFSFILLTWVSSPLFNFLLRFNKFGRMALSREETVASSWIGGFVLLAIAGAVFYLVRGDELAFCAMVIPGLALFPLVVTFQVDAGRHRLIGALATAGLISLTVPLLSGLILGNATPFGGPRRAHELFTYFLWGTVASTWLPMMLRTRL